MIFKLSLILLLSFNLSTASKGKKPDCSKYTCGALCLGSCGWSSLKNKCMYGYKTTIFEINKGPGCKDITHNDDSEDGSDDGSDDGTEDKSEDESVDMDTSSSITKTSKTSTSTHTITTTKTSTSTNTITTTNTPTTITYTSITITDTTSSSSSTNTDTSYTDSLKSIGEIKITTPELNINTREFKKIPNLTTISMTSLGASSTDKKLLNITIPKSETLVKSTFSKTTELNINTTPQKSTLRETKTTTISQNIIENRTEENTDSKIKDLKSSQKKSSLDIILPVSFLVVLILGGIIFMRRRKNKIKIIVSNSIENPNYQSNDDSDIPTENEYLEPTIRNLENNSPPNLYAEVEDSNMYTLASLENGNVDYEYGQLNLFPTFDSAYQETNLGPTVVDYSLGNNEIIGINYDLSSNTDTKQDEELYQNNRYDLAD